MRLLRTCQLLAAFGTVSLPISASAQDRPGRGPRDDKPAAPKPQREQLQEILDLRKEIEEAGKANDPQKMIELVAKLQRLMQVERPNFQLQVQPLFPGGRDFEPAPKSDLRQQYEKQLKEFEDSIAKLKDDKDAREAIEKARDEYKKAMEAELKKADAEMPPVPPPLPRPLPFPAFPRAEFAPLQPLQPFPQLDFGVPRLGRDAVQPRLGVQLERPSPVLIEQLDLAANTGIVITDVLRGMPAEKAGLKKNDILLQWAGKDLPTDIEQFQALVAAAKAGEKFEAVVLRKGKKETIKGIELPDVRRRGDVGAFNQMQVQINGTVGEIQATAGGVKYELTIEMEGRKPQPSKIVITDGEEKTKYESLDKVPEKYKPTVEKLLTRIRGFE